MVILLPMFLNTIPFYYKVLIARNQLNQLIQCREFVTFYVLRKTLIAPEANNK